MAKQKLKKYQAMCKRTWWPNNCYCHRETVVEGATTVGDATVGYNRE